MSRILSPKDSAQMADQVYNIRKASETDDALAVLNDKFENKFKFRSDSPFAARSGLPIISARSGFGVTGQGVNQFAGDAVIITRGTKTIPDLLTDANCGLSFRNSAANKAVHAGFNHTFHSMLPEICRFIKETRPRTVHCVGHSLGGALATLIAEWVATETNASANIYTFGSPRVGLASFAKNVSAHRKIKHVFRAINSGDPIAMVPVWPFVHTPDNGVEYRVSSGNFLRLKHHFMDNYIAAIGGASDWSQIKRVSSFTPDVHSEALLSTPSGRNTIFSSASLEKITAALLYLLRKAGFMVSFSIQNTVGFGTTLYDAIAWKLSNLAGKSPEMEGQVKNLMSHMMAFVGLPIAKTGETTVQAIRAVFNRMVAVLYYLARNTLGQLF